jgi:class 3 adenylate cyclase
MQVCSACDTANPTGARFCSACGAALSPPSGQPDEGRRTVTVIACDLSGFTKLAERLDPELLGRVTARYYEQMSGVLQRYGDPAARFIGDAVVAVFGIPTVHEDDALRAVRAAVDMRAALSQLNTELDREWGLRLTARLAVNTGEVVVSDSLLEESFGVGDAVDVATRLEQAARAGDVLLAERTHAIVGAAVRVEGGEPVRLEGALDPVVAFRLLEVCDDDSGGARRLGSPMVGREPELERLEDVVRRAERERSCLLATVIGNAGVGKSRLALELTESVRARARVVEGRCLAYGDGITFWPLAKIVKDGAGIAEDDPPELARSKIAGMLSDDEQAEAVAERVVAAIGRSEAGFHAEETFWGIRTFLEGLAAERPLVAVFDDLQWAEPTFLDLLEYVVDTSRGRPLVLLCLARPELPAGRRAFQQGSAVATVVRLDALRAEESAALVANLLSGESELARGIAARIHGAAQGNPLFVEEFVRVLIDEGVLERHDGSWRERQGLERFPIPPTIQALLAARLDRLRAPERELLRRASVVGQEFGRGALQALATIEADEVDAHLDELLRKELLRPGGERFAGEEGLRFAHPLLRDVAYQGLLKAARADLHERFAAWVESKTGDLASEYDDILGLHLEQAYRYREILGPIDERATAVGERAARLLGSAGRRALARGDMPAAVSLLERAISLSRDDDPDRPELSLRLGIALAETGELARADALLSERIGAERHGRHFLLYRDGEGRQRALELEQGRERVTIGRRAANDLALPWDSEVSRFHAELEALEDGWRLSDRGRSHNGSFVNGERVPDHQRLEDGDVLRFGRTLIVYNAPARRRSRRPALEESASTATRPTPEGLR